MLGRIIRSGSGRNNGGRAMSDYRAYVGLDVHNDTIAVAIARPGRADSPSGAARSPTVAWPRSG